MQQEALGKGLMGSFKDLKDPRKRNCPHLLEELLLVGLCAITSGANGWVEVVNWGKLKIDWLKRYLPFAHGIASHDTFSRVFNLLDANCFEGCFIRWMEQLCPALAGQMINIDGKSLRGSHNGTARVAHLVSAWHRAAGVVLGQVKTAAKSNEVTAIPELLDAMDVQGATITIDAMGCQHAIVEKILSKQADYIIAVKDNQPSLAQAIESVFIANDAGRLDKPLEVDVSVEKGHGRLETRRCVVAHDLQGLGLEEHVRAWQGFKSAVMVQSTREITSGKNKGQRTTEWRYYISSRHAGAQEFNHAIRSHWGIENGLHWTLDIVFREDECRIRTGHGAQNFAILRRMALNLFKQDKADKSSMNVKRLKAAWSTDYLATLLGLPSS